MTAGIPPPALPPGEQPLERPIENEAQDRFGRIDFVTRLADALVTRDGQKARGIVVGIVGPWGSGKSSILNLLTEALRKREPKPIVVRFDPWLISGRDDLILALLQEVYGALKAEESFNDKATHFLDTAAPYLSVLGRAASLWIPGAGDAAEKGVKAIRERLSGPSGVLGLKAAVEKALEQVPAPVVILIDELDRLRDDEVRTMAQLVRAVADFKHVSYVLAYDQQRVEEALGGDFPGESEERRARGRAYLEKLVHLPVPLPIALAEEVRSLLIGELEAVAAENNLPLSLLASDRGSELVRLLTEQVLDTPRDVLRATGTFRVLAGMVGQEVDALDLLTFSVLQSKFPDVCRVIREFPERFVPVLNDKGLAAWLPLNEERDAEKRWQMRFPQITVTPPARALMTFLLGEPGERDDPEIGPDTLRNRRALLITLRLGLLPGLVSRAETERLLKLNEDDALALFRQHRIEDKLGELLDRLQEVYALTDDPSDAMWGAAARLCRLTKGDWEPRYSSMRDVTEAFAVLAPQRVRRRPAERQRFVDVAHRLAAQRDLHILPIWFQWHALGYGMYGLPQREDRAATAFLDRAEFKAMLTNQDKWVRDEFCHGELFFEIYHPLVLHQLVYAGGWDDACREKMAALLAQPEGVDQLALLLCGGHFLTEAKSISALFNPDQFEAIVAARLEQVESETADPSLAAALRRCIGRDF